MRTLLAPTEDFIKLERSTLNADATAGSSVSLTLKSNDGFSDNDYVVIGHEGSELAELQQINAAVSGVTAIQVATLKFNHKAGEPITFYRYNQRKFYGATSATGTYTELTGDGSPKDIQVDDPQGTILEYTGSTYTHFKATYYNSETTDETSEADSAAVEADESKRYASIWAIRKHAGLAGNPLYSDLRIETKRKIAENEINSAIFTRYDLPLAEVPPILGQICELLAAGYIDYEEFGSDGEGVKWLGEARGLLKKLQKGTQALIGEAGSELSLTTNSGRLYGYPNSSVSETGGEGFKFTIDQEF